MVEPIALRLPVRLRKVASKDGASFAPIVHCPREGRSIDAEQCTGCPRMRSVEWQPDRGGDITCELDGIGVKRLVDPRADMAESAARWQLHEVVEPVTVCVPPTLSLGEVRALFIKKKLRAVPVVDEDVRLLGVISRSDVMAGNPETLVRDAMPERTHALPENAPVAFAIALMAYENVSEVPVVTDEGEIVGLFHAVAALRWTAERMGYVFTGTGLPRI